MSKSQQIAEFRFDQAKLWERYGLKPSDASAVANRIQEDYLEVVNEVLAKHAPQPAAGVTLVQPEAPAQPAKKGDLWLGASKKNIKTAIADGGWVEVMFTSVEIKNRKVHLGGDCVYNGIDYVFTDSENPDVADGRELLDYLEQNLGIENIKDLKGKRVWVQFVDKKNTGEKNVVQFMTLEAYAKRFAS